MTRAWAAIALSASIVCAQTVARADGNPPTPNPSATAATGVKLNAQLESVFLTQGVAGPGLQPVEAGEFAAGGAAAPVSPYDLFSGAPLAPGNVEQEQLALDAQWRFGGYRADAVLGAESLVGDKTNEAYWAEPLQPQDNPHLGSAALGYAIAFPTHPGGDDHDGVSAGVTQASLTSDDGRLGVTGGWFGLKQTLGCVFAPIPATDAVPSLLVKTTESADPNAPGLSDWASPSTLPMRGFDVRYAATGTVGVEAADAELPSLPGTPARVVSISAGGFDAEGHGAMLEAIHVHTGGDPIVATVGFGADPGFDATDQGVFATSVLNGQRESIAGGKAVVGIASATDATIEYASSTYAADGIGKPGSAEGAWEHAGLSHRFAASTVALDYYRFEPTFATLVLPYGVPENVWSVAYSWPGPWLKSNYQLVDSSTIGVNRQGPSLSYSRDAGGLELDATYGDFQQIGSFTTADAGDLGYVDGFYLVQAPSAATFGRFKRATAFAGERIGAIDLGLDFDDDDLHRGFAPDHPLDSVSYDSPEYVLSAALQSSSHAIVADYGWYGMRGSWADGGQTNVDLGMRFAQVGAQSRDRGGETMVTLRRSIVGGAPYFGALHLLTYGSPDIDATTLFIERRLAL